MQLPDVNVLSDEKFDAMVNDMITEKFNQAEINLERKPKADKGV